MTQDAYSLKKALIGLCQKTNEIRLSDIRLSRLIYVSAYALELILYSMRARFIPIEESLFGINGRLFVYAVHVIASTLVMLFWSDHFLPLLRVSVVVMVAGFIPFFILPSGYARLFFGIVAYAGLGGAVTGARCGYAFAANNTERLFSVVFMFLSITGVKFAKSQGAGGILFTHILPFLLLAALSLCLLKFKEADFEVKNSASKQDTRGLYWAFALFTAYYTIDGYLWGLVESVNRHAFSFLCIGMILAAVVLILFLVVFKLNVWLLWNVFFVFAVTMVLLAIYTPQIRSAVPHYFFSGLALLGWPLSIYMLGCAQRRFADYALLKKCTLIFAVLSPITVLTDDLIEEFFPKSMPVASLIVVLIIVLAFLILSPFSYRYLFSSEWVNELHRSDMQINDLNTEKTDLFAGYDLTPRQREVAVLLLKAKTRRQIAGELGLSESTIKMHTAELYRKLNINSRTELFRIFGVMQEDPSIQS